MTDNTSRCRDGWSVIELGEEGRELLVRRLARAGPRPPVMRRKRGLVDPNALKTNRDKELAKKRAYNQSVANRRIASGLCVRCGKQPPKSPTERRCEGCAAKNVTDATDSRDRRRIRGEP